jgi:hypothetical protein
MVIHAYNPSYAGDGGSQSEAGPKQEGQDPI